jgi:hypothetical protein
MSGASLRLRQTPTFSRRQAVQAGSSTRALVPHGKKAPQNYITSDGLVLVPESVRQRLGIPSGGGIAFVTNEGTGHVEMLSFDRGQSVIHLRL